MVKQIIKYLIKTFFNFFGLAVYIKRKKNNKYEIINENDWIPLLKNEEYFYLYNLGLKKTSQEKTDNFSKRLRFFSMLQLVEHVLKNIELKNSNFVECGCWKGHSSFMISSILKKNDFKNKFFIFDSFEGGLSDLQEQDQSLIDNFEKKQIEDQKNFFKSNEGDVKKVLDNFEFVEIFKGWIPVKFTNGENKRFSVIHLDVDLYEKISAAKVSYKLKKPNTLITENLQYIVKHLNELKEV